MTSLQDMIDIQCQDGNWNYDPYMFGFANGLILAQAIVEDKTPVYLDAPDKWKIGPMKALARLLPSDPE